MANYATLIAAIQETIAANGNNEITGPILQQVLVSITNALGSGYQFIGIATPETMPGTPDQRVFYIGASGTYPNFGPAVIPDGNLAIFYYDSSWHVGSVAFPLGDGAVSEPKLATALANKLFADGYKFAGIATPSTTPGTPDQRVFYIGTSGTYTNFGEQRIISEGQLGFFEYNNNWTFETVQVGDANAVKFVEQVLTDSQKAQARTNIGAASDEQVSQLEAGVHNLSKKVDEQEHYMEKIDVNGLGSDSFASNTYINASSGNWASASKYGMFFINVKPGGTYRITGSANGSARYALLKSNTYTIGNAPDYATGETLKWLSANKVLTLVMPTDANWICISRLENNVNVVPSEMVHIVSMEEHEAEKNSGYHREIYYGSHAFGVDAVVGSSTFGKLISAGSDKNWGTSRFYDVGGYNVVSFYTNTGSTSNTIAGHSGAVFYDKDYNPLPDNAWIISKTSSAEAGVISLNIPDGAKYFRFTAYHSASLDAQRSVILSRQSAKFGAIYYGEKISLESENRYSVTRIKGSSLTISTVVQSCALYGDYLFFVNEYIKEIICYNLKTRRDIYKLTTGWTSATWNCHANQSCFGKAKYDSSDMFPILYVSDARPVSGSGGRCAIRAIRIVPTLVDGEITSFTATLIQTIYLPQMTTENGLGYANMVIDPDNNTMWTYSRNTNSGESTSGQATFTQFNIPALTLSEVTLEDSDRLTWFRETWALYNNQGATIKNGKMYMTRGTASDSEVNVIDLYWSKKRVSRIDLDKDGYGVEPEGCFLYNNTICYSGRAPSSLYQLNII